MIGQDYEPTELLYKNGDIVDVVLEGRVVKATIIKSSVEDFYRKYYIRFEDGSENWFWPILFKNKLN